ncbi:MAG: hypothetical protein R6U96_07660 [Promethearchaeia archaeon]
MKWVKLRSHYLGQSSNKKHIFRVKSWKNKLECVFKRPVFNEKYKKIGRIHDIFGPTISPFISVKVSSQDEFNPHNKLYVKMN